MTKRAFRELFLSAYKNPIVYLDWVVIQLPGSVKNVNSQSVMAWVRQNNDDILNFC